MSYVYWSLELYTSTWILMPWFNYTYPLIFVHWSLAWVLYTDPLSFSFVYWSSDFIYYREKKAIALYHDMRQAGKSKKKLSRLELYLEIYKLKGLSVFLIFFTIFYFPVFLWSSLLYKTWICMTRYMVYQMFKMAKLPIQKHNQFTNFTKCKKVLDKWWHS